MSGELLTYKEVWECLRISRMNLLRLIAAGKLPVVYVSERRPRIRRADLVAYLEAQTRQAEPPAGDLTEVG
jgi:excisionase family DNA binding protein